MDSHIFENFTIYLTNAEVPSPQRNQLLTTKLSQLIKKLSPLI